ncbi:MAG: hypothetical protein SOW41_05570 [Anaerococcus sp.]|nr:hypothetical protein [Peptoniphilaceae bacterium]MDY3055517.1 hypothetical protein [Anaerococcus sp.]
MFKRKRVLLVSGLVIFFAILISLVIDRPKGPKDDFDLKYFYKTEKIYESERAFGDDYFDIYKLESRKVGERKEEKPLDRTYFEKIDGLSHMIKSSAKELGSSKDFLDSLKSLEEKNTSLYYFTEDETEGHKLIYIYNPYDELGFAFDLQI